MNYLKKLFSLIILLVILFQCMPTAFADSKVNFYSENISSRNNRIFSLPIYANGDEPICCATFDFMFDSNVIEYRSVESDNDNITVKANMTNGKLKVIFLCDSSVSLSDNKEIFRVNFKAVALEDNSQIQFNTSDCVTVNKENISSTGGNYIVSLIGGAEASENVKTAGNTSSNTSSKSSSSNVKSSSSTSQKSQNDNTLNNSSASNNNEETSTEDTPYIFVGPKDNTIMIFVAGAVLMFVLIAFCVVSYHIGKNHRHSAEDNKKNKN